MDRPEPATPWYREPMVWLVIAIPLSAVLFGFAMLTLSIISWDGLVVDDYDRHGREINRVLSRDRAAALAGIRADLDFDLEARRLRIRLGGDEPPVTGPLELRFLHPTRAGLDRRLDLNGNGTIFETQLPPLAAGHWIVQLGHLRWRLVGSVRLPEQTRLALRPLVFD